MTTPVDPTPLSNDLLERTYQWKAEVLARWLGHPPPENGGGNRAELTLATLDQIDAVEDLSLRHGLRHRFIDLYLQERLKAHEAEMQVMLRGAAAHVNGQKIYLREVIPWCQGQHSWEERQRLQKETSALCRFLKPYLLVHWEESLACLQSDLGYADYRAYCQEKKGVAYGELRVRMVAFLDATRSLYFDAMAQWCRQCFGRPLTELTRFDAIHLLGWGGVHMPLSGPRAFRDTLGLLDTWGMPLAGIDGLRLHLNAAGEGGAQAMTLLLRVPGEVHIIMAPSGGWIDLETLWHELGHGLAAAFTPAGLPLAGREFATDYSLSEAYAFLLQGAVLNHRVLTEVLGLDRRSARRLEYYKALRDLAVFRRYAAKLIWELDLFSGLDLADGAPYAALMRHHTGFYHQPESHLFDLTPELYCCDYLRGMLMAHGLATSLEATGGIAWPLSAATGVWLRDWWKQGHTADMNAFCAANQIPPPSAQRLAAHWEAALASGPPS
jgi:hypothetical protein